MSWATAKFPPRAEPSTNDPENEILLNLLETIEGRPWHRDTHSPEADFIINVARGPQPTIAGPTPTSPAAPSSGSAPHSRASSSGSNTSTASSNSITSQPAQPVEYETLVPPPPPPPPVTDATPLPPFLRLPADVRVLIYPYLWHTTRCANMFTHAGGTSVWVSHPPSPKPDASWLRDAAVAWHIGPSAWDWVSYPTVMLKMDPRIVGEFVGELLKAFPMHVRFSQKVAGELGRVRWLPMPPEVFVENVRRVEVDVCWSAGIGEGVVVGAGEGSEVVEGWVRRLGEARPRVGNCLRGARVLEEVKVAFEVDLWEHPALLAELPGYFRRVCANRWVREVEVGMYVQFSRHNRKVLKYDGESNFELRKMEEQSKWERQIEAEAELGRIMPDMCDSPECRDIRRWMEEEVARENPRIQRRELMHTYLQGVHAWEMQEHERLQAEFLAPSKRRLPLDFDTVSAPGWPAARKFRGETRTIRYFAIPAIGCDFDGLAMGWRAPNLDKNRKIAKHRTPRSSSKALDQPAPPTARLAPIPERNEPDESDSDSSCDSANEENQDDLYSAKLSAYHHALSLRDAQWRKQTAPRTRTTDLLPKRADEPSKNVLAAERQAVPLSNKNQKPNPSAYHTNLTRQALSRTLHDAAVAQTARDRRRRAIPLARIPPVAGLLRAQYEISARLLVSSASVVVVDLGALGKVCLRRDEGAVAEVRRRFGLLAAGERVDTQPAGGVAERACAALVALKNAVLVALGVVVLGWYVVAIVGLLWMVGRVDWG